MMIVSSARAVGAAITTSTSTRTHAITERIDATPPLRIARRAHAWAQRMVATLPARRRRRYELTRPGGPEELGVHPDQSWSGDDDEQRRQDQKDERKQELDGCFHRPLFDPLPPAGPDLIRLNAEDRRDAHAELDCLDKGRG